MAGPADRSKQRYWLEMMRRWQASGLPAKKFCAQEGVAYSTFACWRKNVKRIQAESLAREAMEKHEPFGKGPLRPVVITDSAAPAQTIEIRTARGHVVSIPVTVCGTVIRDVIKALGDI